MSFKGDGWSVVLVKLDGKDQLLRSPKGKIVHSEFDYGFTYYFRNAGGFVMRVSDPEEMETLARQRKGRLYVSREHPRTNSMLYDQLKPPDLADSERQQQLKPFQAQADKLDTNLKALGDKIEALDKRTANIEGLHKVLIRELGAISRETQAQTQCLKELLETNRQLLQRPPMLDTSTTIATTPTVLDEKVEAMHTENKELRAMMNKLTDLLGKVLSKD